MIAAMSQIRSERAPKATLVASLFTSCLLAQQQPKAPEYALTHQETVPLAQQNAAYRWLNVMQEVAAREVDRVGARPTVLSRQMHVWAVAMYDAWAAYDAVRCPTLLLRGAESDLLTRATAELMTQRGPRAELHEFPGVGHAPTLVQEQQIQVVERFLDRG